MAAGAAGILLFAGLHELAWLLLAAPGLATC
jgi:hypothetical protein